MVRKNPDKNKEASSSKSSTPITPNGRKIPQHFIEEIKGYELNNPLRDEYNHPQYNIENKVIKLFFSIEISYFIRKICIVFFLIFNVC